MNATLKSFLIGEIRNWKLKVWPYCLFSNVACFLQSIYEKINKWKEETTVRQRAPCMAGGNLEICVPYSSGNTETCLHSIYKKLIYASLCILRELSSHVLTCDSVAHRPIFLTCEEYLEVPMSHFMGMLLIFCKDQDNNQELWILATTFKLPNYVTLRKIINLVINLLHCWKTERIIRSHLCFPEKFQVSER